MIKAVFFDLGYTFAESSEVDEIKANELLNSFDLNWKSFFPIWYKFYFLRSMGKIKNDEDLENLIRKVFGKKIPVKEIIKLIIESHVIPKENIELVKKIKNKYKVGILSNNVKEWVTEIFKIHKIESLFDSVIISSEVCSRKPDPIIYYEALKSLSVKFSESIFISDELSEDLFTASAFGIRVIWLKLADWKNGCDEKIIEIYKPDAIVENFDELII